MRNYVRERRQALVWENIIPHYQMTVLVEALCCRNPLFADSRRRFYCGVRELSEALIVASVSYR